MDPSGEMPCANGLYLPRDIMFAILLLLPAECLWTVAKNVCRAWADIVADPGFVKAHYLKSKDVLMVQEDHHPHFMISIEKVDRMFRPIIAESYFPCLGLPNNSCRGLIIFLCTAIFDNQISLLLHVANPMTRQVLRLPYLGHVWYRFFKLVYIDQMMEYVAVCLISDISSGFHLYALSLRVDVLWRKLSQIPQEILKEMACLTMFFNRNGEFRMEQNRSGVAAVGGCLYVLQNLTTIAIVNLLDGAVSYIHFPHGEISRAFGLHEKEDFMSCMSVQGNDLVVWTLKDAEWLQFCRINHKHVHLQLRSFPPVGWLGNCLVFTCNNHSHFWVYDVDNAEKRSFSLPLTYLWESAVIHRNTLLRW